MKFLYIISIMDSTGKQVQYYTVDTSLANAIAWAKTQAGNVTNDPLTTNNLTPNGIDHIAA